MPGPIGSVGATVPLLILAVVVVVAAIGLVGRAILQRSRARRVAAA
jgi:hypothetical protein